MEPRSLLSTSGGQDGGPRLGGALALYASGGTGYAEWVRFPRFPLFSSNAPRIYRKHRQEVLPIVNLLFAPVALPILLHQV